MDVKGRKILVVGLGVSGFSSAKLLAEKGAHVRVTDGVDSLASRKFAAELSARSIKCELGKHTERFLKGSDLVVTSPGVDPAALPLTLAKKNNIPVIGELELGFRFCKAPIVAVTGTNGKSTTVELIGDILSSAGKNAIVCGNIGNPLTGEVGRLDSGSIAVVEVSSFQLETIQEFRPYVAVLLNVAEDHYDRHGDFDTYKNEKFRIFENQTTDDWAVVRSDFKGDTLMKNIKSRISFFGMENWDQPGYEGMLRLSIEGKEENFLQDTEVPLKGDHNLENISCAVTVAKIMGVGTEYIRKGVKTFKGLSHRFEKFVDDFEGVEYIDDSKATNIDAARRALNSVSRKVVLIAGGKDKGGDYSTILPIVKDKVKAMVLIGEAAEKIKKAFVDEVPIFEAGDMRGAVFVSSGIASGGETVMLSPMCSSFDMYSSYKERGEIFQKEVKAFIKSKKAN